MRKHIKGMKLLASEDKNLEDENYIIFEKFQHFKCNKSIIIRNNYNNWSK